MATQPLGQNSEDEASRAFLSTEQPTHRGHRLRTPSPRNAMGFRGPSRRRGHSSGVIHTVLEDYPRICAGGGEVEGHGDNGQSGPRPHDGRAYGVVPVVRGAVRY